VRERFSLPKTRSKEFEGEDQKDSSGAVHTSPRFFRRLLDPTLRDLDSIELASPRRQIGGSKNSLPAPGAER